MELTFFNDWRCGFPLNNDVALFFMVLYVCVGRFVNDPSLLLLIWQPSFDNYLDTLIKMCNKKKKLFLDYFSIRLALFTGWGLGGKGGKRSMITLTTKLNIFFIEKGLF